MCDKSAASSWVCRYIHINEGLNTFRYYYLLPSLCLCYSLSAKGERDKLNK